MRLKKIAFLIPAHNEAAVIAETIKALLKVASARDIYIVNDGSKDNTAKIAKKLVPNVLTLSPNQGKANAMNSAIKKYKLASRYKYLMPMDADTRITQGFLPNTLPLLEADKTEKYICIVGKVIGEPHNFMTTYRLWEYEIAQTIHKKAQEIEQAILVCPGCATIFRAKLFQTVQIPTGTLTEDMDLTFLIHRQRLGQIRFTDKAIVITQDPQTLTDYNKQIDRWYTGFWQCVSKHNLPWGGQMLDLEIILLATEGLYNGLLSLTFLFLLPLILLTNSKLLVVPFLADLLLFILPSFILTAIRHKKWRIFRFLPVFYLMRVLSSLVFFRSFLKVIVGIDISMSWNKAKRYQIQNRKEQWAHPSISSTASH